MFRTPLLDQDWAGKAFLTPPSSLSDEVNDRRRYYTSSSRKFTDSSLGGSFEINPPAQFTSNADLIHKSVFATETRGRGRFESEVLDDHAQLIHFRAGVPVFNSMTTFFGNFYNVNVGSIVRTGRETGVMYKLGKVVGMIGTLPLMPFIFLGKITRFFAEVPRGKYYYLKATMFPYWSTVQNLMNGHMSQLGLIDGYVPDVHKRYYDPANLPTGKDLESNRRAYGPRLINSAGAFDVYAIATNAQRLANTFRENMEVELDRVSGDPNKRAEDFTNIFYKSIDDQLSVLQSQYVSLDEYEAQYQSFHGAAPNGVGTGQDSERDDVSVGFIEKLTDAYQAEARMGSQFVTFKVNWTGSQSSSFNNQAGEPSIQSTINSMSSKNRQIRFSAMDGNITGGALGSAINAAKTAVTDLMAGALASVQLSGLIAVSGNAFADIQRVYESSSADFGRTSFTINLRSWCHDDLIRTQTMYLPMYAMLALGLPRATGAASYDGPFLLECYNQGRTLIREGMIESISLEVGSGDAGWAIGMKPLSIDMTVTVVDMSSILSLMVSPATGGILSSVPGGVGGLLGGEAVGDAADSTVAALSGTTYSEDNKYTDFISTMASQPLEGLINGKRRWAMRMAQARADLVSARSPSRIVMRAMDTLPGKLLQAVHPETDRY